MGFRYKGQEIPTGGGGGGTDIPIGCAMLWTGGIDNIPEGWHICDGTNGTIDLRDRFVLGGGGTHTVGETGGSETVTLTVEQMPSHAHGIPYNREPAGTGSTYTDCLYKSVTPLTIESRKTGGSQPHNNMPPYIVLPWIQRVG